MAPNERESTAENMWLDAELIMKMKWQIVIDHKCLTGSSKGQDEPDDGEDYCRSVASCKSGLTV